LGGQEEVKVRGRIADEEERSFIDGRVGKSGDCSAKPDGATTTDAIPERAGPLRVQAGGHGRQGGEANGGRLWPPACRRVEYLVKDLTI
jgi:hypothetical protein